MKYAIAGITPKDEDIFKITFLNGVDIQTIHVGSMFTSTWCLYSSLGIALKLYESIEILIRDFEEDLNQEIDKDNKGRKKIMAYPS